jgi:hypothetical protein
MQKKVLHDYLSFRIYHFIGVSNDEQGKDRKNLKIWTSAVNWHFGGMPVKPLLREWHRRIDLFSLKA